MLHLVRPGARVSTLLYSVGGLILAFGAGAGCLGVSVIVIWACLEVQGNTNNTGKHTASKPRQSHARTSSGASFTRTSSGNSVASVGIGNRGVDAGEGSSSLPTPMVRLGVADGVTGKGSPPVSRFCAFANAKAASQALSNSTWLPWSLNTAARCATEARTRPGVGFQSTKASTSSRPRLSSTADESRREVSWGRQGM